MEGSPRGIGHEAGTKGRRAEGADVADPEN
jgi:hypothetical protein